MTFRTMEPHLAEAAPHTRIPLAEAGLSVCHPLTQGQPSGNSP
ncbi:hypothetical protein ACPUD6_16650 [Brevibacterium sp. FAM 24638]